MANLILSSPSHSERVIEHRGNRLVREAREYRFFDTNDYPQPRFLSRHP